MTEPTAARVRVLIADDHAAIRAGLRLLLEAHGIDVVGEAADGAAAIGNARALRPDVVLMDVRMPGTDGIEATKAIAAESLAQVLVLTTFDLDEYVFGAVRAGAAGFLLKSTTGPALQSAVEAVARGEGALSPEVTRRLLDRFAATSEPGTEVAPDVQGLEELTAREREVLAALGEGSRTSVSGSGCTSARRRRRLTSRACWRNSGSPPAWRPPCWRGARGSAAEARAPPLPRRYLILAPLDDVGAT